MTKRRALAILSASMALGLLPALFVGAADSTQEQSAEDRTDALDLQPGTKCVVTADLECEIAEVNGNAVLVNVKAIREADQGVPMLDKLPYTSRLFKNVGVGRTETNVVISIPRDRIRGIAPIRANAGSKRDHLQQAIEHLQAAGLHKIVAYVHEHVERETCKEQP
jgi:hypothetical protein